MNSIILIISVCVHIQYIHTYLHTYIYIYIYIYIICFSGVVFTCVYCWVYWWVYSAGVVSKLYWLGGWVAGGRTVLYVPVCACTVWGLLLQGAGGETHTWCKSGPAQGHPFRSSLINTLFIISAGVGCSQSGFGLEQGETRVRQSYTVNIIVEIESWQRRNTFQGLAEVSHLQCVLFWLCTYLVVPLQEAH